MIQPASIPSLSSEVLPVAAGLVAVAPSPVRERKRHDRRAAILEGPVLSTLLRLGLPTVGVLVAQTVVSVAETYWTSFLGTDVIAGVALVFPLPALMTAMSNGGIGGGVASAVARAVGTGRQDEADALVFHAVVLAIAFGLAFTLAAWIGAPPLYRAMGGTGPALSAAVTFSAWFFAGSIPIWLVNLISAALRGAGEVRLPAIVTLVGAMVVVVLSPVLIFGAGPLHGMGIAGAGLAVDLYFTAAAIVLLRHLHGGHGRLALRISALRSSAFRRILGVGTVSAVGALIANLTIVLVTAAVGGFGTRMLAGYGIASRLDWIMIPLLFGLGSAVVTMVGVNHGAGGEARAREVAIKAALFAAVAAEAIGLVAAASASTWLRAFSVDPAVLASGARYVHLVAPSYGALGFGMMLYFAGQGFGRMAWPLAASVVRLAVAAGGALLVVHFGGGLSAVFLAVSVGTLCYGAVNLLGLRAAASA